MNHVPRLSVIMASYNHAPYVGAAIESVLSQSFSDFEFIITDDGSTDGTVDVIRGYDDPRISLEVFSQNQGACQAMNRCVARAQGEYVTVINSDDCFLPGKLARQIEIMDARPELAVIFGRVEFMDRDGITFPPESNPFPGLFEASLPDRFTWLHFFFFHGNALCHPTAMIRRRIYDEVGLYDVALRQLPDFDMWIRICSRYAIDVMLERVTRYRVLPGAANTSAYSQQTDLRSAWEYSKVRRRFWAMDDATLYEAFKAVMPANLSESGLPMQIQLAHLASLHSNHLLQLYALETIENAVAQGVPGIETKDLHALTGQLDPFRSLEIQTLSQALATIREEQVAAQNTLSQEREVLVAARRDLDVP